MSADDILYNDVPIEVHLGEDIEPVEPEVPVDLFDTETFCSVNECTNSVDDDSATCWQCHEEFCPTHVTPCVVCDDACCPPHITLAGNGLAYCSSCIKNLTACCVCGAAIHNEDEDTNYCESHDKYCCSSCYAGDDVCNDCAEANDSNNESDANHGMAEAAPWEARGVHARGAPYQEAESNIDDIPAIKYWDVDNTLSLNAGAADFYLLEVVQHNVDCGEIAEPMLIVMAEEARAYRKNLVEVYDRALCNYADMAIGGELRYHKAVGDDRHLPGPRESAWKYWKILRARGGTDILVDTAKLFREIIGGSVGGENWAIATDLLHARLTGRISPEQWVDRCWTLQHNGGAFTNKIAWGPNSNESGDEIRTKIGPAHDTDPPNFEVLLQYASSDAARLFREWWPVANKNRLRWHIDMWTYTTQLDRVRIHNVRTWFKAYVNKGWGSHTQAANQRLLAWDANPKFFAKRFAVYAFERYMAYDMGLGCAWNLTPSQYRIIVDRVLNHQQPAVMFHNVHDKSNAWLCHLCDRIVASVSAPEQPKYFKMLIDRGITIPTVYHRAAGIEAQPALFVDLDELADQEST